MKKMILILGLVLLSGSVTGAPVKPERMRDYCRAEAERLTGVRPPNFKTELPSRDAQNNYIVKGSADLGAGGTQAYECHFGPDGEFKHLKAVK